MTDRPPRANAGRRMRRSIESSNRGIGGKDHGCEWEDLACQTSKVGRGLITHRDQKTARGMTVPEAVLIVTRFLIARARGLFVVVVLTHCRAHFVRADPGGTERSADPRVEPSYVQSQNEREGNPSPSRMPHLTPLYLRGLYAGHFRGVNIRYRDVLNVSTAPHQLHLTRLNTPG